MAIPILQFIRHAKSHSAKKLECLEVLVNLDTLKTFYPAGMRVTKHTPKKAMLVEDPRSRFNGEFWEVYPIATTPTQVYIVCPFCKTIHVHGNAAGNYEGSKIPHCQSSGYYRIMRVLDNPWKDGNSE